MARMEQIEDTVREDDTTLLRRSPCARAVQIARARNVDAARGDHFGSGREVEGGDGLFRADAPAAHHLAFYAVGTQQEARSQ